MIHYETQSFKNGQVLTAECLNRMEAGIKGACDAAPPTCDATDCSKVLSHGVNGCEWVDLPEGKSAYQYAQEGGYTGTEAEFAEKLAEEAPKAFYVTVADNGDGTGTMDKSYEEVNTAYESGSPVIVVVQAAQDDASTVYGSALCGDMNGMLTAQFVDTTMQMRVVVILTDSCLCVSSPIANEPLIGTTDEITPTQVVEAIAAGRDILISHTETAWGGEMKFAYFAHAVAFDMVLASGIFMYAGNYYLAEVYGSVTSNTWYTESVQLAQYTDIPTTDDINALIDAKLGVIENGSY